jgi:broad specificity phosphatase PhoE
MTGAEEEHPIRSAPKIILARHGQTVANRDGFVLGRSDSPLTSDGIKTANALAVVLEEERVTAIFSSPLGRAVATAQIYAESFRVPIIVGDEMAELSCGDWEGKSRRLVTQGKARLRATWLDRPPLGESYKDAEPRVSSFIRAIGSDKYHPAVLVVGHASVNRVFLKMWLNLEPDIALRVRCSHDMVYILGRGAEVSARWASGRESRGLLFETE